MNKPSSIAIALSQEELLVILSYLKVSDILGLDMSVFAKSSKEEVQLALGVAERSLIARKYLKLNPENKLVLEPIVMAIVGSCAKSDKTILLSRQIPKSLDSAYYFHFSRKMRVIHNVPLSGIHQFVAVEESKDMLMAILSAIKYNDFEDKKKLSFELKQSVFDVALKIVHEGGLAAGAVKLIQNEKIDPSSAEAFVESLADPISNNLIVIKENTEAPNHAPGFTLLEGKEFWWIIRPLTPAILSIKTIDSKELTNLITKCFFD